MVDANELFTVMNILKLPITVREASAMIELADHDKGTRFSFICLTTISEDSLLSFDEFLTIFTQISAFSNNSVLH